MSKAVMISIRPKWCDLIANGEKTVELRKSKPKLETPFKCYIYCTKFKYGEILCFPQWKTGKVIGEFVCTGFDEFTPMDKGIKFKRFTALYESRLSATELRSYLNGGAGYGWRITDTVIYDKPKDLSEFAVEGDCGCLNCKKCAWIDAGNGYNVEDDCNLAYENAHRKESLKPLFSPPRSWCYVEELVGGADYE